MRISRISPHLCSSTSGQPASWGSRASTTFAHACTAASAMAPRRDGSRSPPSSTTGIDEPTRLFYVTGSMFTIPVQGYHRYVGPSATMRVKAAALVPVVDVSGHEMNQGETVTMFNDMCVMAPATLINPAIVWEPVDARTARASFTNAGHTIRAELSFKEAGELTNFWSDARYQTSSDGKTRVAGSLVHAARPLSRVRSRAPRVGRRRTLARAGAGVHRTSSSPSMICSTTSARAENSLNARATARFQSATRIPRTPTTKSPTVSRAGATADPHTDPRRSGP